MWKQLILILVLMLPLTLGVGLDQNLTLRAQCVDANGNLCDENAKWTVLTPDLDAVDNKTSGTASSTGLSSFTIWFNQTGVWFVLVNFSSQNHTREYNVVVEDYDLNNTQTSGNINSLVEDFDLIGIALLLGIVIFGFLYIAFKLDKEKHGAMQLILVMLSIAMFMIAGGVAVLTNTNTNITNTLDAFNYVIIGVFFISLVYALIYSIWALGKKAKKDLKKLGS